MGIKDKEDYYKEIYWLESEYNQLGKDLKEAKERNDLCWIENLEMKKEYLDRHLNQAKKFYIRNKDLFK